MAIAVVQTYTHASAFFQTSVQISPTTRPTAGNFCAILCYTYRDDATATPDSISDNQGNTWTKLESFTAGVPSSAASIYYVKSISMPNAGALTVTLSASTNQSVWELDFIELSGVDSTTPIRDSATAVVTGTNSSLTVSTTAGLAQVGDLALAVLNTNHYNVGSANISVPSSYTQIGVQNGTVSNQPGASDYKFVTVAGNQSASWTYLSGTDPASALIAVLKPPSSSFKVRALVRPTFANLSGLKATVWYQPTGTDIHGANIGQYINQSSNAALDGNGNAVIDINVGSSFPVAVGQGVKVLITNGTMTTGIVDGLVQQ